MANSKQSRTFVGSICEVYKSILTIFLTKKQGENKGKNNGLFHGLEKSPSRNLAEANATLWRYLPIFLSIFPWNVCKKWDLGKSWGFLFKKLLMCYGWVANSLNTSFGYVVGNIRCLLLLDLKFTIRINRNQAHFFWSSHHWHDWWFVSEFVWRAATFSIEVGTKRT